MTERKAKSAALLKQLMEAEDLTYEQLAYESGVSYKTIARWLSPTWDQDPSRVTVERVAKRFSIEPEQLWPRPQTPDLFGAENGDGLKEQLDRMERRQDYIMELVEWLAGEWERVIAAQAVGKAFGAPDPATRPAAQSPETTPSRKAA